MKTMPIKELKETVHKGKKKKSIKYAEIHISNNIKFKTAGEKILLTLSTYSLFAADLGYHKSCHDVIRSPKWNKKKSVEENSCGQSSVDELLNLIEYLVVVKKEIYTLAQLRGFYDQISDDNSRVLGSIDIKKIQGRSKDKIGFCKPSDKCTSNTDLSSLPHFARHSCILKRNVVSLLHAKIFRNLPHFSICNYFSSIIV